MSWRNFFYFSSGERVALIVLLCLIVTAGIVLMLVDRPAPSPQPSLPAAPPSAVVVQPSQPTATAAPTTNRTDYPQHRYRTDSRPRESLPERTRRLTSSHPTYPRVEKFAAGTVVELNTADTATLKKVPGIGSTFARRIVRFRDALGGFYSVAQLAEVYGIDEERYAQLTGWFTVDPSRIRKLDANTLSADSLQRHPYISWRQAKSIVQIRRQHKRLAGWDELALLDEFTDSDRERLRPYLAFE